VAEIGGDDRKKFSLMCPYLNKVHKVGTAFSGREPITGRFSVRSDSLHRQKLMRDYPVGGSIARVGFASR
jgi:hypothetical protein